MSYHIKIKDSVPLQYRDHVESWLNNAIDFLLSIPRPQNEQLIPNWDDIRFTICDHFNAPHAYAPSVKRDPAPPLTIDERTQRAIDQHRALWDSVRQGMNQESTDCKS